MELVGHDFYLFHDLDTDKASVVYRRRGWSYGVLHLDLNGSASRCRTRARVRRAPLTLRVLPRGDLITSGFVNCRQGRIHVSR